MVQAVEEDGGAEALLTMVRVLVVLAGQKTLN
jgi:hypothetical protein